MGRLEPLRTPPFGRLLASYFINELGDTVGAIALAILVYDQTQDPLATTALLIAARFVPAFIAPALTARLDQLRFGVTLACVYAVEALCFLALAALADDFSLVLVLGLALIDGTLAVTGRGLTRGAIASTLGVDSALRAGNAMVNVAFAVATILGAVLAGVLVGEASAQTALLLDAASFAVVAGVVLTCRIDGTSVATQQGFVARVREGFAFVRRNRPVRLLLGIQSLALVLFTLIVPIEVVYAKETLDAGSVGFGVLMAAWGGGMVIGSALFIGAEKLQPMTVVLVATALVGAGYLGMGVVRELASAASFSVVGGVGNGVQVVAVVTLLQQETPLALQARVTGLLESIGAAMPGVGFLLGGVLTATTSAPTTYLVAGVGVLVLVAAVAVTPRPRPAAPSGGA